jgi:TPR repeat protein
MNRRNSLFLFFIMRCFLTFSQNGQELVNQANKAYELGVKEKAKQLYLEAAEMNNAEAHFSIAYKFNISDEERIYHFSEAAKLGHVEALKYFLDETLFSAESLKNADPQLAFEVYTLAKKKNPSIKLDDEENALNTIKKCNEAGSFDVDGFINKYGLKESDLEGNFGDYSIWELAEEASQTGRFGNPDPKLVLQLICRGSLVPLELMAAVDDTYKNWKENKTMPFRICDYVVSGIGITYCASLEEESANKEYEMKIRELSSILKNNAGSQLLNAYNIACQFFGAKAAYEEGHDGTDRNAWVLESTIGQKSDYLKLIEKINNAVRFDTLSSNFDWDKELNKTYQFIINELKKEPISLGFTQITDSDIRTVQKLWIPYRDISARLFSQIEPSIGVEVWLNWLTKIRNEELKRIPALRLF